MAQTALYATDHTEKRRYWTLIGPSFGSRLTGKTPEPVIATDGIELPTSAFSGPPSNQAVCNQRMLLACCDLEDVDLGQFGLLLVGRRFVLFPLDSASLDVIPAAKIDGTDSSPDAVLVQP